MSTVLSKPQSRGEVTLRSTNPQDLPRVQMNYLSTEYDMQQQLYGFALRQEFLHSSALSKIITEDVTPGPEGKDEKSLRNYIRNTTMTDWHPSCSCRMGYDEYGVVDPQLRVHGTTGLRIIDASIMPEMPNCNINAACLMIGEKGSHLIKGLDPIQNVATDKIYMDIKA
jgi:choline dehydrogenase